MSTNPSAKLMYGYHLGGPELDGWRIAELNEHGDWKPDWMDAETSQDPIDHLDVLVSEAVGTDITVEFTGHENGMGYAIVAHQTEVSWGEIQRLDFLRLEALRLAGQWDEKLSEVIKVLRITPVNLGYEEVQWGEHKGEVRVPVGPSWILASRYF